MLRRSVCKIVLRPESLFPVTKLICPEVCNPERIKGRVSNIRAVVQARFVYAAVPEVALQSSPMARKRLDRSDIPAITTIKRRKQRKVSGKVLSETSVLEPPGVIPLATPAPERFLFKERLLRGTVLSRPNRFSMEVDVEGIGKVDCWVPTTGDIAGINRAGFSGTEVPCLVSRAGPGKKGDEPRRTSFTVEAISLESGDGEPAWIGINQIGANRYVEHFLANGALPEICPLPNRIKREVKIGDARMDFVYDGRDVIEVKCPVSWLPLDSCSNPLLLQAMTDGEGRRKPRVKKAASFFERLIRHIQTLADIVNGTLLGSPVSQCFKDGKARGVLLMCYLYNAPPFTPPPRSTLNLKISDAVDAAVAAGVEWWQVNLCLDVEGVTLCDSFRIMR
eukprot:jgi/Botrbrau1/14745/Bobra.0108s0088.1